MGSPLTPKSAELTATLGQNQVKLPDTEGARHNVEKAKKAAKAFEAVFISQMVSAMYKDIDMGRFGGGFGEKVWKDHLVQEYGKTISQTNSVGISDQILRELLQKKDPNGYIIDGQDLGQERPLPQQLDQGLSQTSISDTSKASTKQDQPLLTPSRQQIKTGHKTAISAFIKHNKVATPHQSALSAYQVTTENHDQDMLKAKYALKVKYTPATSEPTSSSRNNSVLTSPKPLQVTPKNKDIKSLKLPDLTNPGKQILKSLDGRRPTFQQQRELAILEQELAALKYQK